MLYVESSERLNKVLIGPFWPAKLTSAGLGIFVSVYNTTIYPLLQTDFKDSFR